MKTDQIEARPPSPWVPEQDRATLALLGKACEECGELTAALGRAIIQGVDGRDPETGQPNVAKLAEEFADLGALVGLISERLAFDSDESLDRMARKMAYLRAWVAMLEAPR